MGKESRRPLEQRVKNPKLNWTIQLSKRSISDQQVPVLRWCFGYEGLDIVDLEARVREGCFVLIDLRWASLWEQDFATVEQLLQKLEKDGLGEPVGLQKIYRQMILYHRRLARADPADQQPILDSLAQEWEKEVDRFKKAA